MDDFLEKFEFVITEEDKKAKRLDRFLFQKIEKYSRNYLKTLFLQGFIESDASSLSLSKMPPIGTIIEVTVPVPENASLSPENIPLDVLYEDEYLIVINKQAGIVVHPAPGNLNGTLVNALLYHCKDLKGIGNVKRPGIVHRLDKGTSGVMVIAKEQRTHEKLVDTFKAHDLERQYLALCLGNQLNVAGKIESFIDRDPRNRKKMSARVNKGKKAITHYKVIENFKKAQLVELTLETGRTHQIRVHLSQLKNAPIINDSTYGRPNQHLGRLPYLASELESYEFPLLHAKRLAFHHPISRKQMDFTSSPTKTFENCLNLLKSNNE